MTMAGNREIADSTYRLNLTVKIGVITRNSNPITNHMTKGGR